MLTIDGLIEKGVASFFPTPMSFFENKNLLSGIKEEILSRKVVGIESEIAKNIKHNLKLDHNSNVLVIGCEGDTDKEMYQKLINQN